MISVDQGSARLHASNLNLLFTCEDICRCADFFYRTTEFLIDRINDLRQLDLGN